MAVAAARSPLVATGLLLGAIAGACASPTLDIEHADRSAPAAAAAPAAPAASFTWAAPSPSARAPDAALAADGRVPRRDPARARAALAAFAPALGIVNVTLDATGDGLVVETCSETTEIASVDVPVSRVVSPMATRKGPPCGCGAHALGEGWPAGDGCNRSGCVAPGRVVTTEAACVHVPFEPVAFPRGSAVPPEKLGAIADQLVAILAGRPDLRVTLRGHDRTAKGDGPLAWQRAVVVRDALIARGAPASRLVIAAGVTDDEARAAKGADLADLTTFEAHVP